MSPPEEFNEPWFQAAFQNNDGDGIPDPETYSQWFQQADPATRAEAVGKRRYAAMVKKLDRQPEYSDFIGQDGKLLTVKHLQSESDFDHAQRRAAVDSDIQRRGDLFKQVKTFGTAVP